MTPDLKPLLEPFAAHLPPGGLILSADPTQTNGQADWFRTQGFTVEEIEPTKDLRMLSLNRERYDGIWLGTALTPFSMEEIQRVVAIAFQALKPEKGILCLAHTSDELKFESMLRQNGYEGVLRGELSPWKALLLRRI